MIHHHPTNIFIMPRAPIFVKFYFYETKWQLADSLELLLFIEYFRYHFDVAVSYRLLIFLLLCHACIWNSEGWNWSDHKNTNISKYFPRKVRKVKLLVLVASLVGSITWLCLDQKWNKNLDQFLKKHRIFLLSPNCKLFYLKVLSIWRPKGPQNHWIPRYFLGFFPDILVIFGTFVYSLTILVCSNFVTNQNIFKCYCYCLFATLRTCHIRIHIFVI